MIVSLSCVGLSACGSSDDESSGDAVVTEAPKVLTANTAGKACKGDTDCGTGTCKTQLTMAGLLGETSQVAPGGYCSFTCKLAADCGAGGVCIGANATGGLGFGNVSGPTSAAVGQCLARCDSSSQCREGYRCLDSSSGRALESGNSESAANATGSCQVAAETDQVEAGVVGKECAANEDCTGGYCMTTSQTTPFPDGYCSGRCLANKDCGAGAECVAGFAGAGTCYLSCESDSDCGREGYRCRPNAFAQDGAKRCLPGADPLPDGVVGKACSGDAECGAAAMSCITSNGDRPLPGGYCTGGCVENIDCGATGLCIGSLAGAATGYCYQSCAGAADCRAGYACESVGFAGATGAAAGPTVCTLPAETETDGADAGAP